MAQNARDTSHHLRRQPVAVSRTAYRDPRFQSFNQLPEDRYEAFLSVPLLCRGRVVGVINLQHREPHTYTRRQIRLISTIGFLVGAEIEMARLEGENSQLLQQLETRKLVERAKGILQQKRKLSEESAYMFLRETSRRMVNRAGRRPQFGVISPDSPAASQRDHQQGVDLLAVEDDEALDEAIGLARHVDAVEIAAGRK